MKIKVCVGSLNPVKISGVKKAFTKFFNELEVSGFRVDIDIPPQPFGIDTIVDGGRKRALYAIRSDQMCEYGVGVEAGFVEIRGNYFDVHVAYIVDKHGRESYGFSPMFMVPTRFVKEIVCGRYRELEEVVDSYFGTVNIGEKGGFISVLTNSAVNREELVYYATVMALVPLLNSDLYS